MTRAIAEAELIARRRAAWHALDAALGGPTRAYHLQADRALDELDRADFWLGELERWDWERRCCRSRPRCPDCPARRPQEAA